MIHGNFEISKCMTLVLAVFEMDHLGTWYLVVKKGEVGLCEIQFWMMQAKVTSCGFPTVPFLGDEKICLSTPCS